ERGGFHAKVLGTTKVGHVHFQWQGDKEKFKAFFEDKKEEFLAGVKSITSNMEKRGGGISNLTLVDMTSEIENYWQIKVEAETCNAMGANFINSILEEMAQLLKTKVLQDDRF